ncbi:cytochrome c oxidase assembly protein [Piscinibacter sakaiensis]|uniref:cytochrome c oxidase assembly protein n=1 Tax=Piscinibacter sakaiensis TaxID=1547922 RepID=UPI00372A765A
MQRLSHPVVAWLLHLVVLWGWHAPPLFEAALHHDGVHVLQHASFFVSALLYWWALVQPGRLAAVPLSVATTAMHTGVLGALLTFSTTVWYPHYRGGAGPGKLDALADQHLGGLIMWVPAGAVMLAVALAALVSLLRRLEPAPR